MILKQSSCTGHWTKKVEDHRLKVKIFDRQIHFWKEIGFEFLAVVKVIPMIYKNGLCL